MIDLLAKTAIVASLAVLGIVVVTPAPMMATPQVEALTPVEVVNKGSLERYVAKPEPLVDHLKRLENQVQIQQTTAARISGKLDLLLERHEGINATARPRPKPLDAR